MCRTSPKHIQQLMSSTMAPTAPTAAFFSGPTFFIGNVLKVLFLLCLVHTSSCFVGEYFSGTDASSQQLLRQKQHLLQQHSLPFNERQKAASSSRRGIPYYLASQQSADVTASTVHDNTIRFYQHKGRKLSFRYREASSGYESYPPLVLIHPVGIGLSSWFWLRLFQQQEGPAIYAPDLIGCGVEYSPENAWDPNLDRGLFFPLSWVQQVEALMQQQQGVGSKYVVVAQGGLAPVGIQLAYRNPQVVEKLILTSPPVWDEMITGIPELELQFNYNFLRSPIWGSLAFQVLETKWAIRFFSNLFLFQRDCDERWLDLALKGSLVESRSAVQVFNAGFCNHRSFETELTELVQPTLVLSGTDDSERALKRSGYQTNMKDCTLQTLQGKNVLPWESPSEVMNAILPFIKP